MKKDLKVVGSNHRPSTVAEDKYKNATVKVADGIYATPKAAKMLITEKLREHILGHIVAFRKTSQKEIVGVTVDCLNWPRKLVIITIDGQRIEMDFQGGELVLDIPESEAWKALTCAFLDAMNQVLAWLRNCAAARVADLRTAYDECLNRGEDKIGNNPDVGEELATYLAQWKNRGVTFAERADNLEEDIRELCQHWWFPEE